MNSIFCKNLREARKATGLTQRQVSELLCIAEYRYANWEQGRAEPSTLDLRQLCIIFDVPSDYLLGLVDEDGARLMPNDPSLSIASLGKKKTSTQTTSYNDEKLFAAIKKLDESNKSKLFGFCLGLLESQG